MPANITRRNSERWSPVDSDEPQYVGVTGITLEIIGQTNIWVVFDNIRGGKELQVLVARQEAEEILVDLDTLMDLSIIPKDFPLPQDPKMKEDGCRSVRREDPVEEVAPKLVTIHERQGSIRSKLKFTE